MKLMNYSVNDKIKFIYDGQIIDGVILKKYKWLFWDRFIVQFWEFGGITNWTRVFENKIVKKYDY